MLPGSGWNHVRNPSLSWNAPSASQQHYQPELSSTTRRSKSMRAVLEFKDKASIDWCAEAQALNPFDKRPCPLSIWEVKSSQECKQIQSPAMWRGKQIISGYLSFYHNNPPHVWNSPLHSGSRASPALRQSGRENQSHGVQVSPLQSWGSWLHLICNSGRFSLPYRNQNAATLMHKGVLSIKLLN